jgi:hypothetical protein
MFCVGHLRLYLFERMGLVFCCPLELNQSLKYRIATAFLSLLLVCFVFAFFITLTSGIPVRIEHHFTVMALVIALFSLSIVCNFYL